MIKHDLTGKHFGKLTVINYAGKDKTNHSLWNCRCECGKTKIIVGYSLIKGSTVSCGCYNREIIRTQKANLKHGCSNTHIYQVWKAMKQRCYNKNNKFYSRYGARGITICDEWKNNFQAFYDWSMSNGYRNGLTIDRINNNGNYEPNNCRWVTIMVQENNKSNTLFYEYRGQTYNLQELAEMSGIKRNVLYQRLHTCKWDIEKALTKPIKKRGV